MKKMINMAFVYFIFAIIAGVFYREFTKFYGFSGKTTLSVLHTHLMSLGVLLFLILALFCAHLDLLNNKKFKTFLSLYNIFFPIMIISMLIRGIFDVLGTNLSKGLNASISGVSGITHIMITVAFILLFIALKKEAKN